VVVWRLREVYDRESGEVNRTDAVALFHTVLYLRQLNLSGLKSQQEAENGQ
jgi:hypothetical protein